MPQGGLAQVLEQAGGEPDVIEAAEKIERVRGGTETLFTVAAQAAQDGGRNSNQGLRLYCIGGSVKAARGGSTRAAAERTRRAGRGDDDILMHVTADEAQVIEGLWGKPDINPDTNMPEYGFLKKAWKKVKGAVKKIVKSKVFGMVAPVLLNMIPGIGTGAAIALRAGLGAITAGEEGALLGAVSGAASGAAGALGKAGTAGKIGKVLASGVSSAAKGRGFAPGAIMGGLGALTQAFAPAAATEGQGLVAQQPGVSAPGATTEFPGGIPGGGGGVGPIVFSPSDIDPTKTGIDWGQMLKKWGPLAGAGALALAGGMGRGYEDEGPPPTRARPGFDEPLPQYTMNRQFRGLPNVEDYFTYGQAGSPYSGQQLFLEPDPFPLEPVPDEAGALEGGPGGLGAIGQLSEEQLRAQLYGPQQGGFQRGGEFDYWEQNEDVFDTPSTSRAGGVSARGRYVKGPGTGRSDDIEARLSDGEYVMDAETVALLGDGSSDEGARRLDVMRSNLRKHKAKNLSKGEFSHKAKKPVQYMNRVHGGSVKLKRKRTYEHGGVHNVPRATGGTI